MKKLEPGDLVKIINTFGRSDIVRRYRGKTGLVLGNVEQRLSPSLYKVLLESGIVVCHQLDLVLVK